jgi:hypothetical protein
MALINVDVSSVPTKVAERKRMIEVNLKERIVKINFSSLDIIQDCMRKSYFKLHRKLFKTTEHPALTVGKGVHKALEVWHSAATNQRKASTFETDSIISELLLTNNYAIEYLDPRARAIQKFLQETDSLKNNLTLEARDRSNVVDILNAYFDYYLGDEFEVYHDESGPFVERDFEIEVPLTNLKSTMVKQIFLHGRIDCVMRNTKTGELFVFDHKTTSSLGKDFLNRIKPNFQYTGYFWAARDHFKLPVKGFVVNGIQVAKTKKDFKRQPTVISDEEIRELHSALFAGSIRYVASLESGLWPMSTPNACSMWGSCEFKNLCEVGADSREFLIQSEYSEVAKDG